MVGEQGARSIEPKGESIDGWMAPGRRDLQHDPGAQGQQAWWSGENIPGKPKQFLYFLGGFAMYRDLCEQELAEGLQDYVVSDGAVPAGATS